MGGTESKATSNTEKYLLANFEKVQTAGTSTFKDYRFGNATLWRRKPEADPNDPGLLLLKEKWSMNEHEYNKYKHCMLARKALADTPGGEQYLCKLMHSEDSVETSWCSKHYKNCSAYEYHEKSLAEELKSRKRLPHHDIDNKYFSEPELWYILRAISGGSASLKTRGLAHGDIQPRHVLITSDEDQQKEGGLKLIEEPLIMQYFTGFDRMILEGDYHCALSPEQMKVLHDNRNTRGSITPEAFISRPPYTEKDEVYGIGITTLCSALNNPITVYYDYDTYEVRHTKIKEDLDQLRSMEYSPEFINVLEAMLHHDPQERANIADIQGFCNEYTNIVEPEEIMENDGGYINSTNLGGYHGNEVYQQPNARGGNFSHGPGGWQNQALGPLQPNLRSAPESHPANLSQQVPQSYNQGALARSAGVQAPQPGNVYAHALPRDSHVLNAPVSRTEAPSSAPHYKPSPIGHSQAFPLQQGAYRMDDSMKRNLEENYERTVRDGKVVYLPKNSQRPANGGYAANPGIAGNRRV